MRAAWSAARQEIAQLQAAAVALRSHLEVMQLEAERVRQEALRDLHEENRQLKAALQLLRDELDARQDGVGR